MKLQQIIEQHWYKKNNLFLAILLYPFEFIFCLIAKTRFFFYKNNIFKRYKLPVPVIIIGNISVGGAGKTPLTKYLATELTNLDLKVGIILRGYKSQTKNAHIVQKTDSSIEVGDEALIYALSDFRVAIGSSRYLAGKKLLEVYPDTQLILSDDGLQHYALKRDYEIAVIDKTRMFGNKHCIPMGPLREGINRLNNVNAIVINGDKLESHDDHHLIPNNSIPVIHQTLILDKIYNPVTKSNTIIDFFKDKNNASLAAIGNPERFFTLLTQIGISINKNYIFPDHHHYKLDDIPKQAEAILVTEKDYVKLAQFNDDRIWVVFVKSQLDGDYLVKQIQQLL